MARLSRSDARQSQQPPKCVDRPMAWVRKGCYRRSRVPWVPKAGSCTFQPLGAEHGACAAVCGRHDAAGLDGLYRWQQCDVPLVHVPDARGANRALELRVPTVLRRILMRLRGVRVSTRADDQPALVGGGVVGAALGAHPLRRARVGRSGARPHRSGRAISAAAPIAARAHAGARCCEGRRRRGNATLCGRSRSGRSHAAAA